jgi:transcriptional regulator with XRE-family HTH domain
MLPRMRAAQARILIGARMRELRTAGGLSLGRTAELSGWNKSHLSRVESGATKPSMQLIEWYDRQFGAGDALVHQFRMLSESVRADRDRTLRDTRQVPQPHTVFVAGGSVPVDHDERDNSVLVGETIPDGTLLRPGETVHKTWTLRNAGAAPWVNRWMSRQGTPGLPGWIRSADRIRLPDAEPGEEVTFGLDLTMPAYTGACIAYFKQTDAEGRPYFPGLAMRPLHASFYVTGQ